jgi:hypothetical protein
MVTLIIKVFAFAVLGLVSYYEWTKNQRQLYYWWVSIIAASAILDTFARSYIQWTMRLPPSEIHMASLR